MEDGSLTDLYRYKDFLDGKLSLNLDKKFKPGKNMYEEYKELFQNP